MPFDIKKLTNNENEYEKVTPAELEKRIEKNQEIIQREFLIKQLQVAKNRGEINSVQVQQIISGQPLERNTTILTRKLAKGIELFKQFKATPENKELISKIKRIIPEVRGETKANLDKPENLKFESQDNFFSFIKKNIIFENSICNDKALFPEYESEASNRSYKFSELKVLLQTENDLNRGKDTKDTYEEHEFTKTLTEISNSKNEIVNNLLQEDSDWERVNPLPVPERQQVLNPPPIPEKNQEMESKEPTRSLNVTDTIVTEEVEWATVVVKPGESRRIVFDQKIDQQTLPSISANRPQALVSQSLKECELRDFINNLTKLDGLLQKIVEEKDDINKQKLCSEMKDIIPEISKLSDNITKSQKIIRDFESKINDAHGESYTQLDAEKLSFYKKYTSYLKKNIEINERILQNHDTTLNENKIFMELKSRAKDRILQSSNEEAYIQSQMQEHLSQQKDTIINNLELFSKGTPEFEQYSKELLRVMDDKVRCQDRLSMLKAGVSIDSNLTQSTKGQNNQEEFIEVNSKVINPILKPSGGSSEPGIDIKAGIQKRTEEVFSWWETVDDKQQQQLSENLNQTRVVDTHLKATQHTQQVSSSSQSTGAIKKVVKKDSKSELEIDQIQNESKPALQPPPEVNRKLKPEKFSADKSLSQSTQEKQQVSSSLPSTGEELETDQIQIESKPALQSPPEVNRKLKPEKYSADKSLSQSTQEKQQVSSSSQSTGAIKKVVKKDSKSELEIDQAQTSVLSRVQFFESRPAQQKPLATVDAAAEKSSRSIFPNSSSQQVRVLTQQGSSLSSTVGINKTGSNDAESKKEQLKKQIEEQEKVKQQRERQQLIKKVEEQQKIKQQQPSIWKLTTPTTSPTLLKTKPEEVKKDDQAKIKLKR